MPFFGFYSEPVLCAPQAWGPTAERATSATQPAAATATTTTEWVPLRLLRSRRPPPTPDGTAAAAAAREVFHSAARAAAAAAAEAATASAAESASVAGNKPAYKVPTGQASATAAAAAAKAVGLEAAAPSELKGKYIALFFGASWCPHCRTFATRLHQVYSQLQNLQEQLRPQQERQQPPQPQFETIYIPCDRSPVEFAAFASTMPCALIRRYGVRSLPSVILIRPDNEVLISDAVPTINDRHAVQQLQKIFDRSGPFEARDDWYKILSAGPDLPKPSTSTP